MSSSVTRPGRPKVAAVVQARMGSTRLPGKMLMELLPGKSVLAYLLERLKTCPDLDGVVLATSTETVDDPLEDLAARLGVPCFRGSPGDCLDRVSRACAAHGADVMVRVTGDCPLAPPDAVSAIVRHYLANRGRIDYLSNRQFTDYPEGTDLEVFGADILAEAADRAEAPREREHVNYYFLDRPDRFRIRYLNHCSGADYSRFKLSIDTLADLERAKSLFAGHGLHAGFTLPELLSVLDRFEAASEVSP